ncbi:MAG TPA: alpha/beta hydrolase [Candidatus Nanoarchaeia archaeon]|nr:alpha/beta hydrolase [Candidatus Nanoarchaeia archaeon]
MSRKKREEEGEASKDQGKEHHRKKELEIDNKKDHPLDHEKEHPEHPEHSLHSHHHRKKRRFIIIAVIVLVVFIALAGTKSLLYLNVLLGNDLSIRLEVDSENINIKHGDEAALHFRSTVTTNPFCSAFCIAKVEDLSSGKVLAEEYFNLTPTIPFQQDVPITSPEGQGYSLYRVHLVCKSIPTQLCHTSGNDNVRDKLITVFYEPNEQGKEDLRQLEQEYLLIQERIGKVKTAVQTIAMYNRSVVFLMETVEGIDELLAVQETYISEQKRGLLDFTLSKSLLDEAEDLANSSLTAIQQEIEDYNMIIDTFQDISSVILTANSFIVSSPEMDDVVLSFNQMIDELNISDHPAALQLKNNTEEAYVQLQQNQSIELMTKVLLLENLSQDYCAETGCFTYTFANSSDANETCSVIDQFVLYFSTLERNSSEQVVLPSCVWNNYSLMSIPEKKIFAVLEGNYSISLPEQKEVCCLFGECHACCKECDTPPVVFVHGHAISEDTSYEYSLEGFTKIQQQLEKDGILNAGAITLYSPREGAGLWGKFGTVSIKASYYYDIFEEPENYIVVQTKSENIDTYVVRLKEVIETIKYKTGSSKVKLVGFSMGGLVTRRYVQVFGDDDVEALLTIGTPHKGIEGEISQFCPITGGSRECSDMDKGSLFMNKLNRGSLPNIPFKLIVGTGCEMDLGDGDGAVLTKNALLDGVEMVKIEGKCSGKTHPLHLDLLDIDRYPQVYEEIIEFVK